MVMRRVISRGFAYAAGAVGALALSYAAYVARTWYRYGRVAGAGEGDPLLDRFMPVCDVAERHETRVGAPAAITYEAAHEMDMYRSGLVRAIFRGRELLMRATPTEKRRSQSLLEEVLALGWGVLIEEPGHEIVVGAVTRPWEADVQFRSVPPDEFAAFREPRYVKIVWNLAAEPLGSGRSVFRTETRVATTDVYARERFRRYWAAFSPGILLIRRESLRLVKADAERRHSAEARRPRSELVEVR
jgi:hypothetical protein